MVDANPHNTRQAMHSLRNRWLLFAFSGGLAIAAVWFLLFRAGLPAWRWLPFTAVTFSYLLVVFWQGLAENRRPDEERLLPRLGPGNWMTLLRGLLTALLAGFLLLPRPEAVDMPLAAWLPGILYGSAVLADFLDGYLARISGQSTRLGERLDMSFDGIGVLVASALAVSYGQAPLFYLLVGLARYLFIGLVALHSKLGLPVHPLPANPARRGLAGLQMGFLTVLLLPVFTPPGTHLASAAFALPFLAGFARDALLAAGWVSAETGRGGTAARRLMPLALRAAAAGLVAVQLASRGRLDVLAAAALLVAALLSLGAAGRVAAIGGLLLAGLFQAESGWGAVLAVQVAVFTALLVLGSGPFSLWRPEENLIYRRAGEKHP